MTKSRKIHDCLRGTVSFALKKMLSAAHLIRRWSSRVIRNSFSKQGSSSAKQVKRSYKSSNVSYQSSLNEYLGAENALHLCIYIRENSTSKECITDEVVYKDDKDRFSQRFTMKLKTFFLYRVRFEIDQDEMISYVMIGGKKYNCFYLMEDASDGTRVFEFVWSTDNILQTKRKHRSILPCVIQFNSHKKIRFRLLVKFYEQGEWCHYTGKTLKLIDLQVQFGVKTTVSSIGFEQQLTQF